MVSALRVSTARDPDDPGLTALVDELARRSRRFRGLRSTGTVRRKPHGPRIVRHPVRGAVTLCLETPTLPHDPDRMLTYTHQDAAEAARCPAAAPDGAPPGSR